MVRYKPYEKYKDSGVEWIGEIPEHWEVKRIKHFCNVNPSKTELKHVNNETEVTFLPMESIGTNGTLDLQYTRQINDVISGYTYCTENDIIVAKITPCFENGKGAICRGLRNGIAFGTTELFVLRAVKDALHKHVYYITKCQPFRAIGEAMMQGAAGQKRVTENFIRDFIVGLPPRDEQQAIALFLDQKTSEIDSLIADKEKLVTLLQEYRQAIISEAVTKGLNPDVKMKDSGVEWIGEIPEHWEVKRLDFVMSEIRRTVVPRDLRVDNVFHYSIPTLEEIEDGKIEDVSSIESGKLVLSGGELLVSKLNPRKCRVVLTTIKEIPIVCSTEFVAMKPIKCFPRYVTYLYQVDGLRHFFSAQVQSVTRSHQRVRADVISKLKSCLPPIAEQEAIADYLDQKASEVDDLISGIQESIAQHKSYRQSLISEAVTGKIDVRGVI